jgi:SNF family Na+-dependent transporter
VAVATVAGDRAQWGSRLGFILAAAGSAVGLGNIWRFPYTTGENGGGWFVLIYLICVALVGLPIMMSEIMIGRAAQRQPVAAFHQLQGKRTSWAGVGWLGVIAGFIILSYYIVIAGWAMDYTLKSIVNIAGPIREDAIVVAAKYRATGDLDQMREDLVLARAQKRSRQTLTTVRNGARPSAWRDYDVYKEAIASDPGLVDVALVEAAQAVWAGEPQLRRTADGFGVGPLLDVQISGDQRDQYELTRSRLLEKAGFGERVLEAEALLVPLHEAMRSAAEEARLFYGVMDDAQIRDEAEDRVRRNHIRDQVQGAFGAVAGDGWMSLFWTGLFMLVTILIVAGGISGGIERACLILMPTLFALILVLVIYGMFTRGFGEAAAFVFKPDASKLRPSGVLSAMGQAFFSLSLGMGAMITYGSYQRSKEGLAGTATTIAAMDTLVALLACGMIFPIVFTFGQEPSAGPGLVFMTMPLAFAEIGRFGMVVGAIFFGLLVFAAITSSISLLEVVASYFIDERGWSRNKSVWILGLLILALAIPSAFAGDAGFAMSGWMSSSRSTRAGSCPAASATQRLPTCLGPSSWAGCCWCAWSPRRWSSSSCFRASGFSSLHAVERVLPVPRDHARRVGDTRRVRRPR